MSWLRRLFGRTTTAEEPSTGAKGAPASMRGVVQPLEVLRSPVSGEECVSIRMRVSVPAAFGTLLGGVTRHDAECHQAVEFLLRDGQGGVLVRPSPGRDVERFHAELVARHGLDLECLEELVCEGDVVTITGRVVEELHGAPHRRAPYRLVVAADSISLAE